MLFNELSSKSFDAADVIALIESLPGFDGPSIARAPGGSEGATWLLGFRSSDAQCVGYAEQLAWVGEPSNKLKCRIRVEAIFSLRVNQGLRDNRLEINAGVSGDVGTGR